MAWISGHYDDDGQWVEGYDDGKLDPGSNLVTDGRTPQELRDQAAADALGISYKDYIAGIDNGTIKEDTSPVKPMYYDSFGNAFNTQAEATASDNKSSTTSDTPGFDWTGWAKKVGMTKKDASGADVIDWGKIGSLGAAGTVLGSTLNQPAYDPKSAKDLLAMQPSNAPGAFSATQMASFSQPLQAGNQLTRQYAADMPSPIAAGKTFMRAGGTNNFAEGGEVQGPLSQVAPFSGAVQDASGGQADMVDAKLSGGEYVLDAETVSMLGDGNTAAGIAKLDQLRQQLRAQKRAAPADDIPQEAQGPLSYIGAQQ